MLLIVPQYERFPDVFVVFVPVWNNFKCQKTKTAMGNLI